MLVVTGVAFACHARHPAAALHSTGERVVLLRQDMSLAAVSRLVEFRETEKGEVKGRMQVWSGDENRPSIEHAYGCRMTRISDYGSGGSGWRCDVPFGGGTPDWRILLARLDSLVISSPPAIPQTAPAALKQLCADGNQWTLEVRRPGNGTHARYASTCGPPDSGRDAFEAGLSSVLNVVEHAARVR